MNYVEQKANHKQAVSEENDLQALLASVLVPLIFGTLRPSHQFVEKYFADLTIVSELWAIRIMGM